LLVVYVRELDLLSNDEQMPNTFAPSHNPWVEFPWKPNPWENTLAVNVNVSYLPDPSFIPSLHFTYLDIHESYPVSPVYLLEFLTALPAVECFKYKGWSWSDEGEISDDNHLPVVELLQLRTLRLRTTCSTRAILSHLRTPMLTELRLEYLNVEFELPENHNEDGDSEDEAHDYSQSPFSDHNTGMGLRTLINRCSPPLKVIDMDYSDMRTKDFEWCFDRLTELEMFRIVASDMSDNVMRLFKPYRRGDGDFLFLRLPMLTSLELQYCRRLSGDAIVDTITTRLNVTDSLPGSTLTDVTLIGCEDLAFEHIHSLSTHLGSRLHLSDE
jgi:hypothetical protein